MNRSTSFKATVDPSVIRNAPAFFDNNDETILRELLQNSRRANSTRIDVHRNAGRYSFRDNGLGCDPKSLLVFGGSNWRRSVRESESPAGIGFFSLARRNPVVTCPSRGWKVQLEEGHFTGELAVEVEMIDADKDTPGLLIEFDYATKGYHHELPEGFLRMIRYMPLEVFYNDRREITNQDAFAEARAPLSRNNSVEYIDPTTGMEVQIIVGLNLEYGHQDKVRRVGLQLFYGNHCVALDDKNEGCVELPVNHSKEKKVTSAVRVKVTDESKLPLELPQRNKVVRTPALEALIKEAKLRALALMAEIYPTGHTYQIPFWVRARDEGYTGKVPSLTVMGNRVRRAPGVNVPDYSYDVAREDGEYYGSDNRIEDPASIKGDKVTLQTIRDTEDLFEVPDDDEQDFFRALVNAPVGENEDYFAAGVQFVRLYGVHVENPERYDFIKPYLEAREILENRSIGCYMRITRTVNGQEVEFDSRTDSWGGEEECPKDPTICDAIKMELYSPGQGDGPDVVTHSWDLPAYFDVTGSGSDDIGMMFTRKWLDKRRQDKDDFSCEIVEFAKHHRDWWDWANDGCYEINESDESDQFYGRTDARLQSYGDLTPFLREKLEEGVREVLSRYADLIPASFQSITMGFDLDRTRWTTKPANLVVGFHDQPQVVVATAEEAAAQ